MAASGEFAIGDRVRLRGQSGSDGTIIAMHGRTAVVCLDYPAFETLYPGGPPGHYRAGVAALEDLPVEASRIRLAPPPTRPGPAGHGDGDPTAAP